MYCDLWISKKNSFRGNYMRKYGMCVMHNVEIRMQLNKYFGPISFSISTVFRTSRCVTYNIWTGIFLKPHRGFKLILFPRFKNFVIVFLPHDWFLSRVTKSFKKIQAKIDSEDYENVPSLQIFLSICWIDLIEWIDFKITHLTSDS